MIRFCVQRSSDGYPDIQLPNSFERHGDICRGARRLLNDIWRSFDGKFGGS